MSRKRKQVLFERGAEAARRVIGTAGIYFCPICQSEYDVASLASGLLTLEHVPPASLGGRGIALTCKTCNNTAGHTVDAELHRRNELERFAELLLQGEGDGPLPAVIRIAGETANVQVVREEGGRTLIQLTPRNNNPDVMRRIGEHIGATRGAGQFNVTARARYSRRLVKVGELRSAFLAAFALFGYRYAFHPYLDSVRHQILHPNEKVIEYWNVGLKQDAEQRAIALIREPRAVLVQLGSRGVLLPPLDGPADFYEQLRPNYESGQRTDLTGQLFGWPETLLMHLDFEGPEAQSVS